MAVQFPIGDLVWAKMKGYSAWPAKIAKPTKKVQRPNMKQPMHYVYFFGADNHAWILDKNIFPYEQFKEKYANQSKTKAFKSAVEKIVQYSQNPQSVKSPVKSETTDSSKTNGVPQKFKALQVKYSKLAEKKYKVKKVLKPKKFQDGPQIKVAKTGIKRRLSETSSTSSTSNKPAVDKFTALFASTPPNSGYSSVSSVLPLAPYTNSSTTKQSGLLTRPVYIKRPATPPLDIEKVSEILQRKNVIPSRLKFGFLGLGIMGRGIVKNLINSGHNVTVWNRTPGKCRDFVKAGAIKGQTPADVVAASDITFSCVSDLHVSKELVFGNCGVLKEIECNKGYVEMTSVDPDTSQDIASAIVGRGGRFLEAPLVGSKIPSEMGTLIILAAGDRSLFIDCKSCFEAMGKHAFYLGSEIGNAAKMNLILNMILGTSLAALAEAMALADRTNLAQKDVLEILELGPLNCTALMEKGQAIIEGSYATNMPLQHMQRNLHMALSIGDQVEQPLPLTAAANEVYKHAKRISYGEHDVSAVYMRARF